jgi:hypothetical protein
VITCSRSHRAWRKRRACASSRVREIQRELVVGHVQVAGEVGEVLRQDRRDAVGHDGNADIAAGHHLLRQASDDAAELSGEQRTAHASHERARSGDELSHLLRGLLVDRRRQRPRDRVGDGLGELLPDRKRRLDPLSAGHGLRRGRRSEIVVASLSQRVARAKA